MERGRRFQAPTRDGGLLVDPPWQAIPSLLKRNLEDRAWQSLDIQGSNSGEIRASARREVMNRAIAFLERNGQGVSHLSLSPDRPLILTGHQPELFHPGVWSKNFAAVALADAVGGTALNLIVDNDIPHRSAIRVPSLESGSLRTHLVHYDRTTGETPYEEYELADADLFRTFPKRVRQHLDGLVKDPILNEFWGCQATGTQGPLRPTLCFALKRRKLETAWGYGCLEIPLSEVCETEGFRWLVAHILAQLPRFQEVHNRELEHYRQEHRIRSYRHPVPALGGRDGWLEAPFWVWRRELPRRKPLLVRRSGRELQLRITGENEPFLELPLGPERDAGDSVALLARLPRAGIRLRSRALTTTLFSRLLLGDLFIHGIGGAKYDELGDRLIRGFFGCEPPGFVALSMTVWLGLPDHNVTASAWRDACKHLRELRYNPDRHLEEPIEPELLELRQRKWRAIESPVLTRAERVNRFREIRECNEELVLEMDGRLNLAMEERRSVERALSWNRVAQNREYSFLLHSSSGLRRSLTSAFPRSSEVVVSKTWNFSMQPEALTQGNT